MEYVKDAIEKARLEREQNQSAQQSSPGPSAPDRPPELKHSKAVHVEYSQTRQVKVSNQVLLDNMAVDPACQGKGLGSRLLVFAEARAMALQYPSIDLCTHALMVENRALYARRGYKETARRREQGFDRVYLRKMLTP